MAIIIGRQIVPSTVLREAFVGSQVNPAYGLTFWLNHEAPNGREADMERMLDLALAKRADGPAFASARMRLRTWWWRLGRITSAYSLFRR